MTPALLIYALLLAAVLIVASAGRREGPGMGAQGERLGRKSLRRCGGEGGELWSELR